MPRTRKPCPACKQAHPYRLRDVDDLIAAALGTGQFAVRPLGREASACS